MSKVMVKITGSKFMVPSERPDHKKNIYAKYKSLIFEGKKLLPMLIFFKSRSKVTFNVKYSKLIVLTEGLVLRNTHAKYEKTNS